VQYRGHSHPGTQFLILGTKVFQGADRTRKQDAIDLSLMSPCQGSQLIGQGEGHYKILDRQQLLALSFKPAGSVVVLASVATAVAAGVKPRLLRMTGCALQ
jgi:hypothetical protein